MTFSIKVDALAEALKDAASVVEARSTLPILAMVRIVANDSGATMTTSNLDIEYRQTIDADVSEPAEFCIDARRLLAMAQAASGEMSFDPGPNDVVAIRAGRSRWAAPSLPAQDFPDLTVGEFSGPMRGKSFSGAINRTVWAASTSEARYYLAGVFLNNENGFARMVATNGNALAMVDTSTEWPDGAPDVIIPTKLAIIIASVFDDDVTLEWDDRKMRASSGSVTVTGKMIDGTFPNYRRIFPQPCEPYQVDTDAFIRAVRRVRIASDAQERKLRITRHDGSIHLRIEGTSGFEGAEEMAADCVEGFETGVFADELSGMLTAAWCETVSIEQSDPAGIMTFRPTVQSGDVKFTGLIMPIRI